jgi:hypothetical protein
LNFLDNKFFENCSVEKEFFKSYFCVNYAVGNCRVACPPTTTHRLQHVFNAPSANFCRESCL